MQNIYDAPPPHPEKYHELIEEIKTIVQGIRTQGYDLEVMAQANAVLTRSNSAVMSQLAHMNVTINAMQVQLKTIASAQTNQSSPKRNHYFWSCGRNYTHGSKTYSSKKAGNQ